MLGKLTIWLITGLLMFGQGCVETAPGNRLAATANVASSPPGADARIEKMNENVLAQVTLKADAEISGNTLVITYEASNQTEKDLYLWDGTIGFEGASKVVDPDRVYVFFEEPDTVRVIRANLPLPRLRRITRKQILFARLLKAKSSLKGQTKLPLPLVEHSPYYEPPKDDELKAKKCSRIRLMIGWTEPKIGMKILEKTIKGEQWFSISGTWQQPYQEIVEQYIPLNVELMTYTTKFERQMPLR